MGGMGLSEGVIDEARKIRLCVSPLYVLNGTKVLLQRGLAPLSLSPEHGPGDSASRAVYLAAWAE